MNIIDGKKISAEIKEEIKAELGAISAQGKRPPCLAVVLVGGDKASGVYVESNRKNCERAGIKADTRKLPAETSESELIALINELNSDVGVDGILVQLPLPAHIDERRILSTLNPAKDMDCFNPVNAGLLSQGTCKLPPCTPAGIIELIKRSGIEISGKNCVVLGRSNIVGKPVSQLLLQEHGTVTICHSKTQNLAEIASRADILVAAIGKPRFVTADMVKPGAVIIDVGIHRTGDGKLVGDVDYEACAEKASYITPVPGGVGPMTIAMLMKNCLAAYRG